MPRHEEFDWIFDFALQFLESDKFDAAVMDFVDEKCFVFEDTEENKFVYSDIHKEFCDHIDALISSNLGELGISNELFVESCTKARHDRDINATVFERLTAMDDFQTFKKIMTKRNTELQLEAIQNFKVNTPLPPSGTSSKNLSTKRFSSKSPVMRSSSRDATSSSAAAATITSSSVMKSEAKFGSIDEGDSTVPRQQQRRLPDPDELAALLEAQELDLDAYGLLEDDDIQDLLLHSLMEMELIHRQEELEHAELERALNMSIAMEEERLHRLMADSKQKDSNSNGSSNSEDGADSKGARFDSKSAANDSSSKQDSKRLAPLQADSLMSDTKPLRPLRGGAPLPSIGSRPMQALDERKKLTEDTLKKNMQLLAEHRKQEDLLRQQLAGIDPVEAQRRAEHMKRQRELLIAKKKQERGRRVQEEEERTAKQKDADREVLEESLQRLGEQAMFAHQKNAAESKDAPSTEEQAEMRRASMRTALARRMRMNLIETEEERVSQLQEEQFSELDKKLKQVEQLREDNRKREFLLNKQLERQQAQIARNVRLSAAEMQTRNGEDL